jgi:cathepsin L
MKSVLLVALFVVIGSCSSLVDEWETWKLAYNKKYVSPDEEVKRYNVWIENKKFIELHNKKKDKIGYTLEMNKFGDITTDEFSKLYTVLRMDDEATNHGIMSNTHVSKDQDIPSSWDWRSHGYVTPVKNQGHCGGASVMAIVEAVEGQHFKATNHLVSLSTQQVIDCASTL